MNSRHYKDLCGLILEWRETAKQLEALALVNFKCRDMGVQREGGKNEAMATILKTCAKALENKLTTLSRAEPT